MHQAEGPLGTALCRNLLEFGRGEYALHPGARRGLDLGPIGESEGGAAEHQKVGNAAVGGVKAAV